MFQDLFIGPFVQQVTANRKQSLHLSRINETKEMNKYVHDIGRKYSNIGNISYGMRCKVISL